MRNEAVISPPELRLMSSEANTLPRRRQPSPAVELHSGELLRQQRNDQQRNGEDKNEEVVKDKKWSVILQ
ncbi:hypothetical protein OJAV_G00027110 [Oryzias javanicus]|uniref:Uncharacterized protein n=1 Tax=Oryzias javanicus TaxID=123683 RepID=A0A437DIQ5_ORYJA|nr:hypothetical protein OJAV_G00027110 [Oryzias javanicus]